MGIKSYNQFPMANWDERRSYETFDVNSNIELQRTLCRMMQKEEERQTMLSMMLREAFGRLDDYLKKGGALPKDWQSTGGTNGRRRPKGRSPKPQPAHRGRKNRRTVHDAGESSSRPVDAKNGRKD